jgi:hypothetical protein
LESVLIDLIYKLVYRAQFYLNVPAILQLLRFREIRNTYYQQLWQEAARNIDASAQDWDFGYIRKAAGLGFRWLSPVGPLRLEWGYNLDPEGDEETSVWDFSIGGAF